MKVEEREMHRILKLLLSQKLLTSSGNVAHRRS